MKRSPSLVVVRYFVELFRNGDITSREMHEAITTVAKLATAAQMPDTAEVVIEEQEEIRQGVLF